MKRYRKIQMNPCLDTSSYFSREDVVAVNLGCNGHLYFVVALKEQDYTEEVSGWAIFPKVVPERPQSYRVLSFYSGDLITDIVVSDVRLDIHSVQPLPNEELLLVCSRCRHRSSSDIDQNALIVNSKGEVVRRLTLGDGIEDVCVSQSGEIWVSYFDEGVMGNFGWTEPLGCSGLVSWDAQGEKQFEFTPEDGLDGIIDCYAMNVFSTGLGSELDVWIYYYTDFPLVRISNQQVVEWWEIPLSGSNAFAISNQYALFASGYQGDDFYHLFELQSSPKVKKRSSFSLYNDNGILVQADCVKARGDTMYIMSKHEVYELSVDKARQELY